MKFPFCVYKRSLHSILMNVLILIGSVYLLLDDTVVVDAEGNIRYLEDS